MRLSGRGYNLHDDWKCCGSMCYLDSPAADRIAGRQEHLAGPCGRKALRGVVKQCFPTPNADRQLLEMLLDSGAKLNPSTCAPLTVAAQYGNLVAARVLVEHGAVIDQADADGRTPLMYSAKNGEEQVLRFLLEHGADINHRSKAGKTAMDDASGPYALRTLLIAAAQVGKRPSAGPTH